MLQCGEMMYAGLAGSFDLGSRSRIIMHDAGFVSSQIFGRAAGSEAREKKWCTAYLLGVRAPKRRTSLIFSVFYLARLFKASAF